MVVTWRARTGPQRQTTGTLPCSISILLHGGNPVELSQERLGNWGPGEDGIHLAADLFLSCAGYGIKIQKRPGKGPFGES
jgi:hypothetical protein